MTKQYMSSEEAKQNKPYLKALTELLYQLADDDLIVSHRASEWLGLGPHIEEDVAFSSITQDTMGHAVIYYQLLEELGEGKADDLAHLRKPEQLRNAILAERVNGEGHYLENPNYDWAYAIIRNYMYEVFKKTRLDSLEQSTYAPLADVTAKIKREQFYHLYHWEVWIDQLSHSTEEAHNRLNAAVAKTWKDIASLLDAGSMDQEFVQYGLIESGKDIQEKFLAKIQSKLASAGLDLPGEPTPVEATGREGRHTEELTAALEELSQVYRLAPQANW